MAYAQQIPKENPARRNKPGIPDTLLQRRDGTLVGPELPKERAWCKETREWWDMWRRSEIAVRLEPSDWHHLKDTALLHNEYWQGGLPPGQVVAYKAEIRRSVAAFGATLEDRLKLRIKFADGEVKQEEDGTPKSSVAYRDIIK